MSKSFCFKIILLLFLFHSIDNFPIKSTSFISFSSHSLETNLDNVSAKLKEMIEARSKESVVLQLELEQLRASESEQKQEKERLRSELDRYKNSWKVLEVAAILCSKCIVCLCIKLLIFLGNLQCWVNQFNDT